jgi:hypothetical protein
MLRNDQCKWLAADEEFPDQTFRQLSNFTHSRPDSSDGELWESNGPVFAQNATTLVFFTAVRVYAICYLLVRIARPRFIPPRDSRILFEADWVPNREGIAKAFDQLYGAQAARTISPSSAKRPL